MNWKLITTTTCPKCPEAQEWAEQNLDDYQLLHADTNPRVMQLANDLNIIFVPAFVDEDDHVYTLIEMKGRENE